MVLEIGTVCMKIAGREGGRLCTIVKKVDKSFVITTGPKLLTGIKRRKCNIHHLEPTAFKLDIKEDATDEEVIEAYKKSGVVTKFKLKLPSVGEMKTAKEKKPEEPRPKKAKAKEEKK